MRLHHHLSEGQRQGMQDLPQAAHARLRAAVPVLAFDTRTMMVQARTHLSLVACQLALKHPALGTPCMYIVSNLPLAWEGAPPYLYLPSSYPLPCCFIAVATRCAGVPGPHACACAHAAIRFTKTCRCGQGFVALQGGWCSSLGTACMCVRTAQDVAAASKATS